MKKNLPLYLFAVLAIVNLYAEFVQLEWLIFCTKPLLMGILAYWFYLQERPLQTTFQRFILTGILFSLGGDTLLMLVENGPKLEVFFLLGLGSFLIAQLSYGWAFINYTSGKAGLIARQPLWAIPFLFYLAVILVVVWPGLNGDLKIPVTVYASAIVAMCITAFNLKGVAPTLPWRKLMAGVLLFVLSDSLIALNKFAEPLAYARMWIMLTYLTGQLLIVYGAWEMQNFLKKQVPQQ